MYGKPASIDMPIASLRAMLCSTTMNEGIIFIHEMACLFVHELRRMQAACGYMPYASVCIAVAVINRSNDDPKPL